MEALLLYVKQFFGMFRVFKIIRKWEMGVRVWRGKFVTERGPGISWLVPILHSIEVQSTRLRVSNCETQTVQTRDGHALTFAVSAVYGIEDMVKLYLAVHLAEDTVTNMVSIAAAKVVAETDRALLSPGVLASETQERIQFGRLGLKVRRGEAVGVTDFVFAKAYRLITDTRDKEGYGSGLDTESLAE